MDHLWGLTLQSILLNFPIYKKILEWPFCVNFLDSEKYDSETLETDMQDNIERQGNKEA
jgi:hypothetical protein